MGWHDALGGAGVILIVTSYLLLQMGRLELRAMTYSAANAAGAALILVSLTVDFNLAAAIIEAFWLGISVLGMVVAWRARLPTDSKPQEQRHGG